MDNESDNELDKSLDDVQPTPPTSLSQQTNVGAAKMQGRRPKMEDTTMVFDLDSETGTSATENPATENPATENPTAKTPIIVVGLFDGHNGLKIANMCQQDLEKVFVKNYIELNCRVLNNQKKTLEQQTLEPHPLETTLEKTFKDLHANVDQYDYYVGTTALVVVFSKTKKGFDVTFANAGDSRAIIIYDDQTQGFKPMTNDHKGSYEPEQERVKAAGGSIVRDVHGFLRVNGVLAVTRAIGDLSCVKYGVTCVPEITKTTVQPNDIIVIACDGLWDVLNNQKVDKIVREYVRTNNTNNINTNNIPFNTTRLAEILRDKAYSEGSTDNISVIVVRV